MWTLLITGLNELVDSSEAHFEEDVVKITHSFMIIAAALLLRVLKNRLARFKTYNYSSYPSDFFHLWSHWFYVTLCSAS